MSRRAIVCVNNRDRHSFVWGVIEWIIGLTNNIKCCNRSVLESSILDNRQGLAVDFFISTNDYVKTAMTRDHLGVES